MIRNKTLIKYTFAILSFILCTNTHAQTVNDSDRYDAFMKEVKSFINASKRNSILNGKYDVYLIRTYHVPPDTNSFCFTMSCEFNQSPLSFSYMHYYFYIDSDIVTINENIFIDKLSLNKINIENEKIILAKLFPKSRGAITGSSEGIDVCFSQDKIYRSFYKYSDDIPKAKNPLYYPWDKLELKEIDPRTGKVKERR